MKNYRCALGKKTDSVNYTLEIPGDYGQRSGIMDFVVLTYLDGSQLGNLV